MEKNLTHIKELKFDKKKLAVFDSRTTWANSEFLAELEKEIDLSKIFFKRENSQKK